MKKSLVALFSALACQVALAGSDAQADSIQESFARFLNHSAAGSEYVIPVVQEPDPVAQLINAAVRGELNILVAMSQRPDDAYGENLAASFTRMLDSGTAGPAATSTVRGEPDAVDQFIAAVVRGDRTATVYTFSAIALAPHSQNAQ